jgi:hypothetical protein
MLPKLRLIAVIALVMLIAMPACLLAGGTGLYYCPKCGGHHYDGHPHFQPDTGGGGGGGGGVRVPNTYGVVELVNEAPFAVTYYIRAYYGGGWTKRTLQPGGARYHWYRPATDFEISFSSGSTTKKYNLDANVIQGRAPNKHDGRKYFFWKGAGQLDLYKRSPRPSQQTSSRRAKERQELLASVTRGPRQDTSHQLPADLLESQANIQALQAKARRESEQKAIAARERGRQAMREGNWSDARYWFRKSLFECSLHNLPIETKATWDALAEAERMLQEERQRREREEQEYRERQRREQEAAAARQRGQDAMAARDWSRAIGCFQEALGYLPDDKTSQNLLAKAQQELKDEQRRRELEQRQQQFNAAVYNLHNTIAQSPSGGPILPLLDATMMAQVKPPVSNAAPFSEPEEPFRLSEEEWANLKRKLARHAGYLDPQEDALLVWLLRDQRGPHGYDIPRKDWIELISTEYLEELLRSMKIGNVNTRVQKQRARIERFRELAKKRGDRRAVVLLNNEELQIRITQQFEIKLIEAREARSRDWAEEMDKLRAKLKSYETLATRERDDPQFAAEIKAAASRVWERYLQREREAREWVERENAKYPWREKENEQDPQENLEKQAKIRDARIKWAFAATKAFEARQAQADCEALDAYESFVAQNKLQNKEAPLAIQVKTDNNARTLVIDYLIPIRTRLWEDEKKIEEHYRERLNREIQEILRGTGTPGVH